jgi:hypothetical protein
MMSNFNSLGLKLQVDSTNYPSSLCAGNVKKFNGRRKHK